MISGVTSSVTSVNDFVDINLINTATGLTKNITNDVLTRLITSFSSNAIEQLKNGHENLTKGTGKSTIYIGYKILVTEILRVTYRECILDDKVDVSSKVAIIKKARNIYRNSRVSSEGVIMVKNSIEQMVNALSNSKRTSTNTSLKIGFILYIILLGFKHMK
jgi:hypothetical protein